MDDFLRKVDPAMLGLSGRTFYSGRATFDQQSDLYLLGLNPGGKPEDCADEIIRRDIDLLLHERAANWSAYVDDRWDGRIPGSTLPPGAKPLQRRVQHLCRMIGRDIRRLPASNVIFVRTKKAADLQARKNDYLRACWPVHQAVIHALGVKVIVCIGAPAGVWVRKMVGASRLREQFIEDNARRWVSEAHDNDNGPAVVTLTHGSVADWTAQASDPSGLVRAALERAHCAV